MPSDECMARAGEEIVAPMFNELADDLGLGDADTERVRIALVRMFIQGVQLGTTELAASLIEKGVRLTLNFEPFEMPIYPSRADDS